MVGSAATGRLGPVGSAASGRFAPVRLLDWRLTNLKEHRVSKDKPELPPARPQEQRGLIIDVVVPVAQSAISGGVGAVVGSKLGNKPTPPQQDK